MHHIIGHKFDDIMPAYSLQYLSNIVKPKSKSLCSKPSLDNNFSMSFPRVYQGLYQACGLFYSFDRLSNITLRTQLPHL